MINWVERLLCMFGHVKCATPPVMALALAVTTVAGMVVFLCFQESVANDRQFRGFVGGQLSRAQKPGLSAE